MRRILKGFIDLFIKNDFEVELNSNGTEFQQLQSNLICCFSYKLFNFTITYHNKVFVNINT